MLLFKRYFLKNKPEIHFFLKLTGCQRKCNKKGRSEFLSLKNIFTWMMLIKTKKYKKISLIYHLLIKSHF